MEMETFHICVVVLCTSGLIGGGTVEGLIRRRNVTVRCTDENNSKNEIQFWCNMENSICSSMEVNQEIITIYKSSIQPSSRKLVFRARREGVQNSDLDYYSCQTVDEVNTPLVSTVPDPVTKALPGSHRDMPHRNKRDIIKQIKEEESKSQQKPKGKKGKTNKTCKNKNKCSGEEDSFSEKEDSTKSTNSGGDSHGSPEGGKGKTEGGDGKTEGGVGETEGGKGKTEGGDDKTEGGVGETEGGDDKTEGGDGKTEGGDGKTEGGDGETEGGDGKTEGGNGGSDPEGGNGNRDAEDGTGGHNGKVGDGKPDNSLVVLHSALGALAVFLLILVGCSVHLWMKRKPQRTLKAGGAGAQQGESEKKVVTVYAKATNPSNAAPQPVYNATGHIYQEIMDTPQDLAEVIHNPLYTPCGQPSQEQQSGPQGEPPANGQYSHLQLPVEQ